MVCRVCEKFKTCDSPYCGNSSMIHCGYYEKAKQTNADRIRSMTDEELAEMLSEPFPYNCARQKCNYHWKTCKECALDWLRQEAVDNGACLANETSEKVQNE